MTDSTGAVARAAERDAAGDHDEAINELARGTSAGDPRAARQLGLRLLLGERAPLLPEAGLRFLGEAADGGLPEAAARAAGLLALGVRTPPDWPLALQWLGRAAEGGWAPAQAQLRALCDDRARVADHASDWRALVAGVRLDDWRRSPPAVIHNDDPRISTFPGFVRPEICATLIDSAHGRLEPALVYDPVRRVDISVAHRNNTLARFDVDRVDLVHVLLQSRMAAACGLSERTMEAPTVLHYHPGEQIDDHYDFVSPDASPDYAREIATNGQRMVTFIVYLNDDYDGGETDFPRLGFTHKGTRGEGIYFVNALPDLSPDRRMLHAGRPTTRGEKWIVTQFVRSHAMR